MVICVRTRVPAPGVAEQAPVELIKVPDYIKGRRYSLEGFVFTCLMIFVYEVMMMGRE